MSRCGALDHRADPGRRILRVADRPLGRLGHDPLEELVAHAAMDDEPRAAGAVLAHVRVAGEDDVVGDEVEVARVGHHDLRALAAAFEDDPLEVALRRVTEEQPTDLRRAREREDIDVGVSTKRLAGRLAEARDHVEDAVRDPGFGSQLGEAERAERGELGRLDDQAVAGGERGRRLPGRHHDREVPRQDRPDDPDRLADDHAERVRPRRRDRVVQLVGRLRIPSERLDRLRQVRVATIRDRLARLERVEQRELLGIGLDQVGQAKEDGLALGRGAARPAAVLEGSACGGHGEIDFGGVAGGDLGQG